MFDPYIIIIVIIIIIVSIISLFTTYLLLNIIISLKRISYKLFNPMFISPLAKEMFIYVHVV